MCVCSVRACVSPKITLRYPHNQTTNDNIIAQAFQNTTQKVCCSYINLQQPPNRPLWVLYHSPSLSSLLSARLSHIHPPHSASLRASVEIRSSLSEVLCHVAQGAWNSPRAVEQTQAQGLSIAAPQTNCLSNEPPSLSCPHTHTVVRALWHSYAHTHTGTHTHTRSRFDSKSSDTLLEEKTHEWHFSVHRLVSAIVTGVCSAVTVRFPFCYIMRGNIAFYGISDVIQTHPTHPTVYQLA